MSEFYTTRSLLIDLTDAVRCLAEDHAGPNYAKAIELLDRIDREMGREVTGDEQ